MNRETRLLTPSDIAIAAEILRGGGLVALPTETVYGLAVNALDGDAVLSVFTAKGRPQDNPLIVHVSDIEQAAGLVSEIPGAATRLIDAFWPGPLTLVLRATDKVPRTVTCGLPTVAVRCPSHPVTRAVIEACGLPLAAPSANLSGRPSPTAANHVMSDLDGRIDAVIDGGNCEVGLESTVLDMTVSPPCILRTGAVTRDMLQNALGSDIDQTSGHTGAPRSPGMKYRHYSPATPLYILSGAPGGMTRWANTARGAAVLCCDEQTALFQGLPVYSYGSLEQPPEMMRRLYALLREADAANHALLASTCPGGAQFAAFKDRLYRAAGYREIRAE